MSLAKLFSILVFLASATYAEDRTSILAADIPRHADIIGVLREPIGRYLRIAGKRAEIGLIGTNTISVNEIGGRLLELDKPILITLQNIQELPPKQRIELEGYETGSMAGGPPDDVINHSPGLSVTQWPWHFRTEFVVIKIIEPTSLKLEASRGRSNQ